MSNAAKLTISDALVAKIRSLSETYAKSIGADPPGFYFEYYMGFLSHARAMAPLGSALGIRPGHRVVEIGSGMGTRCLLGRALWGAEMTGIEPCANSYDPLYQSIGELRASNPHLPYDYRKATGEDTGLPSDTFDFALSFEVLEHVQEPARVVSEVFRILKPGGTFFFTASNYHSFYEGHFRCPWWPSIDREQAARWVRFLGYNDAFLGELNFITRRQIEAYLEQSGFSPVAFDPKLPAAAEPSLEVAYPASYRSIPYRRRRSRLQTFIQRPLVHKLLERLQLEYKLTVLTRKPPRTEAVFGAGARQVRHVVE